MHQAMLLAGWDIGRGQTVRQMKLAGVHVVRRGRQPVTRKPGGQPDTRQGLVERKFIAERAHQLWVAYIAYVRNLTGFCYVGFITGVCSRCIVGWAVSASLRTAGLDATGLRQHALVSTGASRGRQCLVHQSDRGSQYVNLAYSDALIAAGLGSCVGRHSRGLLR